MRYTETGFVKLDKEENRQKYSSTSSKNTDFMPFSDEDEPNEKEKLALRYQRRRATKRTRPKGGTSTDWDDDY